MQCRVIQNDPFFSLPRSTLPARRLFEGTSVKWGCTTCTTPLVPDTPRPFLQSSTLDIDAGWCSAILKSKNSSASYKTFIALSCNNRCKIKNTLNTLTTPGALVAMPAWPEALIYNFAELWQNPEHPFGCTLWLKKNGDWRFYCAIFSDFLLSCPLGTYAGVQYLLLKEGTQ